MNFMSPTQISQYTIMIVDDDVDLLDMLKETLIGEFAKILTVSNPKEVLNILKSNKVDCIITDYRMPEMDGLTLISRLEEEFPHIPVILLTGNGSNPEVIAKLGDSKFDFLEKPFKPEVLLNRIRSSLLVSGFEYLIENLLRAEFDDLVMDRVYSLSPSDRLRALQALTGIVHTRLLNRESSKRRLKA